MKTEKKPAELNLFEKFPTDDKARQHLESIRWASGIVCPKCQCKDQTKFSTIKANPEKKVRAGLRYCAACKSQFTVTIGTIFEDSHIPLRKWVIAWYLLCSAKKGISSLQLQRNLKLGSYRTALFMTHRIRHALKDTVFTEKLTGTIEADECYIGGMKQGVGAGNKQGKAIVVSMVQRGGAVRSQVVPSVHGANLKKAIRDNVQICSEVHTDANYAYRSLEPKFNHHCREDWPSN